MSFPTASRRRLRSTGAALICLCLSVSTAAFAQQNPFRPGYVVLTAAPTDTLRGEVDLYRADRAQPQVAFRPSGGEVRQYGLAELDAAGETAGRQFRKRPVPVGSVSNPALLVPMGAVNAPALLQVLVAGPASLYFDPTGQLPATYYLDKPGVAPMPLKQPQFVQVLRTAFADCPGTNASVGNYLYSSKDLRRYVENYNRCLNPQAPVQAQAVRQKQEHVRWGVQAGVTQLRIYYPYTPDQGAMPGPLTPTLGVTLALPVTNHLGFLTGLTYNSFRSDNTFDSPYIGSTYTQTTRIRTRGALLRLPLSARLTLRRYEAAWRPYLQGGIQLTYLAGAQIQSQATFPDPSVPIPPTYFKESLNGMGLGVQGEIGALFHLGSHQLSAGGRFDQANALPVRSRSGTTDFYQFSFALTYYH